MSRGTQNQMLAPDPAGVTRYPGSTCTFRREAPQTPFAMASRYPQRPETHQREAESVAFVQAQVPHGWTFDQPEHDYGVDLRLGLARNGQVTGEQLVVQLKASAVAPQGKTIAVTLDVPTLNFLRNMLEVAMVVKYVAAEKEAYWLLLKDVGAQPYAGQKTVTIRIPRANRLSAQPWDRIADHVQAVHSRKLKANIKPNRG